MCPKKRCPYCGCWFRPDPRVGDEQKACPKKSCRKKRHDDAHAKWCKDNPDAYQGRYSNVRTWLDQHPGYLGGYRAEHPDYVKADNEKRRERRQREKQRRADIQDERLRREIEFIRVIRGADIQDTIRLKIDGILGFLESTSPVGRADIQDSMARRGSTVTVSGP